MNVVGAELVERCEGGVRRPKRHPSHKILSEILEWYSDVTLGSLLSYSLVG